MTNLIVFCGTVILQHCYLTYRFYWPVLKSFVVSLGPVWWCSSPFCSWLVKVWCKFLMFKANRVLSVLVVHFLQSRICVFCTPVVSFDSCNYCSERLYWFIWKVLWVSSLSDTHFASTQSFIIELAKCFVIMKHTLPESSKSDTWLFLIVVCMFCGDFLSEGTIKIWWVVIGILSCVVFFYIFYCSLIHFVVIFILYVFIWISLFQFSAHFC